MKENGVDEEPSVLVAAQRAAQLAGTDSPVTVLIKMIKHLYPFLLPVSEKKWGHRAAHTFM